MKLPGFLMIGLTAIIIAVDAQEISTTELPKETEVTGSSVHDLTITATKNPLEVKEYKRICSYYSSDQYRPGKGKFFPEDMDASLCTHIVFASANISDNHTVIPYDSKDDGPGGMYERFTNLKKNSSLVTLLFVIVSGSDLVKMSKMLETNATRQQFINSSMNFARKRNFEGILLGFYYPAIGTSQPKDKERFTLLLKEFREAIEDEAKMTGKSEFVIGAVLTCRKDIIEKSFEPNKIHQYVDFVKLNTYDFLYAPAVTVHYSALFASNKTDKMNTVEGVAEYYVSHGVPRNKILIDITMFAPGYTLENADDNGLGAPVVGPSPAGEYTQEPGRLAYYEICPLLNDSSVTKVLPDIEKAPYLYNDTLWIGYNDQKSMAEKANFIKKNGYAGWYVRDIGSDDFNGTSCNQGRYPLLRALSETLMQGSVTTAKPFPHLPRFAAFPA